VTTKRKATTTGLLMRKLIETNSFCCPKLVLGLKLKNNGLKELA
jgi:hypothetical protein